MEGLGHSTLCPYKNNLYCDRTIYLIPPQMEGLGFGHNTLCPLHYFDILGIRGFYSPFIETSNVYKKCTFFIFKIVLAYTNNIYYIIFILLHFITILLDTGCFLKLKIIV
jgi:hypothetical protein